MIMVVMFVFSLVELILFATDTDFLVPKRSDLAHSAVSFFYAVTIIFMVINVIGFIAALLLRREINKSKTGGTWPYPASCRACAMILCAFP